jgi:hypothetical protein
MPDAGIDRTRLPIRRPRFAGTTKRTLEGSEPDWSQASHVQPPEGAPNVLLVLIDDAGFGNPSTFGGPIRTPNSIRTSIAQIDEASAKELKTGLKEASAGLAG